jgi:hypothetical protein
MQIGNDLEQMDDLDAAMASPTWGKDVVAALRRYFAEGGWLLEPVKLIEARLGVADDGSPAVIAIYDHSWYSKRIGLKSRLDQSPMAIPEGMSPSEALAQDIAVYEISEPLGTYYDRLIEDEFGVWWWKWPMDE